MLTYHVLRDNETIALLSTGLIQTALDYVMERMKGQIWVTGQTEANELVSVVLPEQRRRYRICVIEN